MNSKEQIHQNHTPGPWRWELNEKRKRIELCGGVPKFDKIVMDFVRYGMQGGKPRFLDKSPENEMYNVLKHSDEFGDVVEGREHHAHWFKTLNHPDANLIAAAPDLLQTLLTVIESLENMRPPELIIAYAKESIKKITF